MIAVIINMKNQGRAACGRVVKENTMAEKNTKPKTKAESLQDALDQIEKQFGKGSIMLLGDDTAQKVEAISTG